MQDLSFTVIAMVHSHSVVFTIYEIMAWEEGDVPLYGDYSDSLETAAVFLHGSVKWDGCSNWHFDAQDACMLHGCSREDLTRMGEVMGRCWDWAAQLLPNWQG